MQARTCAWLSGFVVAAWSCLPVHAQWGPEDVDPFEVRSADGKWSLSVDPSSRWGRGPANYRLSRGSEVAWSGQLPYTLEHVHVGADGAFAGTADGKGEDDTLHLMLIGPDGKVRYEKSLAFQTAIMHGPNYPNSSGVCVDPEHDRVVFRIANDLDDDAYEEWRSVRWSSGELISSTRPAPPLERDHGFCFLVSVEPIAGLPLLACCWSMYSYGQGESAQGVRYSVIDFDAHAVWELDRPHDGEVAGDEARTDRIWDWIRSDAAMITCKEPKGFDAMFIADAQRVTFEVSADAAAKSGWSVREVARRAEKVELEDYAHPKEPPKLPPLPLSLVGTVELQAGKPARSEFFGFDIDDRGRMGYVTGERGKHPRFELRDSKGGAVLGFELAMPDEAKNARPSAVWLQGERWLLHASYYDSASEEQSLVSWMDLASGVLTPITDLDCAPIEHADGTFDGGFVALAKRHMKYTIEETLSSFDAEGHLRWRDREAYGNSDDGLFSPEDVRASPRGEIGVLDNIRHLIQSFDLADGKLRGAIELEKVLGREPSYPTELGVTPDGNWVVYDFDGSPSVLCVSRDEKLTSSFTPHFADGRAFMPKDGIHVAPDGRMWASDGYALLRLDELGTVDLTVGEALDTSSLGEVECAFIDAHGRTFLADERTHSVHVFDAQGKSVAICNLAPSEVSADTEVRCISEDSEGHIHVAFSGGETHSCAVFDARGTRVGTDSIATRSVFQPGKSARWLLADEAIRLFDAKGVEKKALTHTPDNKWLDFSPDGMACSADGSLVLASRGAVHVFSPEAEPLISLPMPPESGWASLAFADHRVFLVYGGAVWCIDLASHAVSKSALGAELSEGASTHGFWNSDAGELWILDEGGKKVLRYRVQK